MANFLINESERLEYDMNIAEQQQQILQRKYKGNFDKLKEARPWWNRTRIEVLAMSLTADVLKYETIEGIPSNFIDDFPRIKSAQVFKPNENGEEDIPEDIPKGVTSKALKAFNEYCALFGTNQYKKNDIVDVAVKEILNTKGLRGCRYVGFLTKDGKKFRWLLN